MQLPMAKGSLVLATNQGLLFVLAMVVIGGLVGAGALGYDVVYALAHLTDYAARASPPASRSCCWASSSTGWPAQRPNARAPTSAPSRATEGLGLQRLLTWR